MLSNMIYLFNGTYVDFKNCNSLQMMSIIGLKNSAHISSLFKCHSNSLIYAVHTNRIILLLL